MDVSQSVTLENGQRHHQSLNAFSRAPLPRATSPHLHSPNDPKHLRAASPSDFKDPKIQALLQKGQEMIEQTEGCCNSQKLPLIMIADGSLYKGFWMDKKRDGLGV